MIVISPPAARAELELEISGLPSAQSERSSMAGKAYKKRYIPGIADGSADSRRYLPEALKGGIFSSLEEIMGTKVKPVQPTEIKDKKIAREVIEQIRKPIPASVYKQHEKKAAFIDKVFRK
jgi:hypothetical protein